MCLAPITIPNPYYGLGMKGLNCLHNTHDTHITVPCGSCQQCVSLRQTWYVQRIQMESLRSHLFMFTLTYKDDMLKHLPLCTEYSNLTYPFWPDVQNMFKRLRKQGYKFRYWVCSEYGTLHHRPHFHGILALDKNLYIDSVITLEHDWKNILANEWKRNMGSKRKPIYKYNSEFIFTRNGSTFDFHYIEPYPNRENDCAFYVGKYIMKYDCWTDKLLKKIRLDPSLDEDTVSHFISCLAPRSCMSKDFGDYNYPPIKEYITGCLNLNDKLPQYFDLYTGKSSLLSRYYRKHLTPCQYYIDRFAKYSLEPDSFIMRDSTTVDDDKRKVFTDVETLKRWNKLKKDLYLKYL